MQLRLIRDRKDLRQNLSKTLAAVMTLAQLQNRAATQNHQSQPY